MKSRGSIPVAPGAVPLLGHLLQLLRDPCAFLTSLPAHGDLVMIQIAGLRATVVCDSELTWQVLRDDRTFDKGGTLYDRAREAAGNNVVTCPHSEHRHQRRHLQPAFRPDRLAGYLEPMRHEIATVTRGWHDGQTIDPLAETHVMAARILLAVLFGTAALPNSGLSGMVDDVAAVTASIYRRMLTPRPFRELPTPGHRRYLRANDRLRHITAQLIAERQATGAGRDDLLSIIVASSDAAVDGPGLSSTDISDQVLAFLVAGTDTTADLLSWAMHVLAHDQALQQRLHREVDGIDLRTLTFDDLPRLTLTRAILMETLRCYPPIWILTRTVVSDTELGGHHLPAGSTLVCSPYLVHHRPDLHPDPERFEPDRWLGESPGHPRPSLVPFGAGARKCVADALSFAEATLALAHIAAHWRLQALKGRPLPRPLPGGTLKPRKGSPVLVTKRGALS